MKFLSARWEHLLLANYSVPSEVLQPYVPAGTRLDCFDGIAYVSLVAFLFNRTRVLGIPVPGHTRFEEVNLRFYVVPIQHPERRAVTFLREIVPLPVIPWIANSLFHENYTAYPMSHSFGPNTVQYSWQTPVVNASDASSPANNTRREHTFSATIDQPQNPPEPASSAEFITEHYWGYARSPRHTLEYQVTHPKWDCCEVSNYTIDVDFASNYGEQFGFLTCQTPVHVLYAAGSQVTVGFPNRKRWAHLTATH